MTYQLIFPPRYRDSVEKLTVKLSQLSDNRVTFKNEIHRTSRFALAHYLIDGQANKRCIEYDHPQSVTASYQKKTNSDPRLLDNPIIPEILGLFLDDIADSSVIRAEVKLINTQEFPFEFNPHRDSQFRRLRNITYLATVIISASGIDGGNMQLFESDNDKLGPFRVIEELPVEPGVGYIVDERPQRIFHGMKTAVQTDDTGHRAALLIRFFNTPIGFQRNS